MTTPITDDALAEIKAGLEGLGAAEWYARPWGDGSSPEGSLNVMSDTDEIVFAVNVPADYAAHIARMSKPTVASMIARIEAAEARVKRLEEALGDCAEWFKGYGDSHTAKGDIDKAQRNYDRERRARAALEGE